MLTNICLKNFKCFAEEVNVPIRRLNLLTGVNGRGKSSVLQSLLLMRQSPEHSRTTDKIIFNGSCVELGNFNDIRSSSVPREKPIELGFAFSSSGNNASCKYILKENFNDDMVANIDHLHVTTRIDNMQYTIDAHSSEDFLSFDNKRYALHWHNLLFRKVENFDNPFDFVSKTVRFTNTHYVSADRIGPREFYAKQSFTEFPNVGKMGEFTANILAKKRQDIVDQGLRLSNGETDTLIDQTGAWLSKIFDGGTIRVSPSETTILSLSMNSENSSTTYKPTNIGFGYSYVLPIIVSGLIATPGERLIVENPEAHLHPYAQSQLARFLSRVSATGVQVFIETHSEHILNSLRISVLDKIVSSNDLNVLYFRRHETDNFIRVQVEPDGAISNWPKGFFDQSNLDFSRLFGV